MDLQQDNLTPEPTLLVTMWYFKQHLAGHVVDAKFVWVKYDPSLMYVVSLYADKEMDKEHSLGSGWESVENLEADCERKVSGVFAFRRFFVTRIKAEIPLDHRGIEEFSLYLSFPLLSENVFALRAENAQSDQSQPVASKSFVALFSLTLGKSRTPETGVCLELMWFCSACVCKYSTWKQP